MGSILGLIGVAPFSIFLSEHLIIKAALDVKAYVTLVLFIVGASTVFIGLLHHAIDMSWGKKPSIENHGGGKKYGIIETLIVVIPLLILLVFGIIMPAQFRDMLTAASKIITGG